MERVEIVPRLQAAMRLWPLVLVLIFYSSFTLPRLVNYPPPWVDDAYFMAPGHSLLTRGIWGSSPLGGEATRWRDSHPDTVTYFQPPFYLMLVAGSFKILGFGLLQARLVSALLGLGTVIITYFLALKLSSAKVVSLIASLLLSSQPLFVRISRQTRPEAAVIFFTLLAVYAFVSYQRHSKASWSFLSGMAIGAALMSHYNGIFGCVAIFILFFTTEKFIEVLKSKGFKFFLLGVIIISLPYAFYVLQDCENEFYNFITQITVIGKAGKYNTVWEYAQAETIRYQEFFHDYRFVPNSDHFLKALYLCALAFALLKRNKVYTMLLLVISIHLVLLMCPSPNKTSLYLGVVLPYFCILVSLFFFDLKKALHTRILTTGYSVLVVLLLITLFYWNGKVWQEYYKKYRECDYYNTIAQVRQAIPSDTVSVMGRYTFWIGLSDYEYYRWGFRTFEDITATAPDIFIHNDYRMMQPDVVELKAQLDQYFDENAELIGIVAGHPRGWCHVGDLKIYKVEWARLKE